MRDNARAMVEDTELELLITVVVSADDAPSARGCCQGLLDRVGGRIVECADCSDEEPGCWSVTISRGNGVGTHPGSAALSRAVRNFLRELGSEFSHYRVSCEPPTAWTVVDNPELVQSLVTGGERLLVEVWAGGSASTGSGHEVGLGSAAGGEGSGEDGQAPSDLDGDGRPRPRLGLLVDVVTERRSGAEWPARALASRLSHHVTIAESTERPPMVRVTLDLGPRRGEPSEIVEYAASLLGGGGWSRVQMRQRTAVTRWSAVPTPPSGIAAIELTSAEASEPDSAARTRVGSEAGAGG